jgi:UDP-3-O-[3-hydroxymyristoyl] glucosamine N-acyltransferase
MKLSELARQLSCELRGNGDVEIERVQPIETAGPGDLTFVANPRYRRHLSGTRASAVILAKDAPETAIPSLRADDPYLAFAEAVERFYRPVPPEPGIHPTAVVAASARVGPRAAIGAYAVIGANVEIGADARIAPHVVVYPDVTIGDGFEAHAHATVRERVRIGRNVVLHSGAVVGSDGFGFVVTKSGEVRKLPQAGDVVIEDDVEVGANTTIDRATVGSTHIGRGVKLDNLVIIAHGCQIGEGTMIAAQVGLSGSTRVGRRVRIGGQAGAAGHLTIGDGAQVAAQSGVANSVAAGTVVGGYPATEIRRWRRVSAALLRLPELLRRVRHIEDRLGLDAKIERSP